MTDAAQTPPDPATWPLPTEPGPEIAPWWLDQEAWPPHRLQTPSGEAVFWGVALIQIGRAIFGEQWKGPEFGVQAPPNFPPWPAPYPEGRGHPGAEICRKAKDFVERHDPEFHREASAALQDWVAASLARRTTQAPPPIPTVQDVVAGRWTPPPRSINSSDIRGPLGSGPARNLAEFVHGKPVPDPFYQRARELSPLVGAEGAKLELRARQVEARVSDACVMGQLRTIWLNAHRKPCWFDDSWWNIDPSPARRERFSLCRIAPLAPFIRPSTQATTSWIYVLRADLDAFLATIPPPARPKWWPQASGQAIKTWLWRPEVQAEALSRIGTERTKGRYAVAVAEMWAETDSPTREGDSFARELRQHKAWPEGLAE